MKMATFGNSVIGESTIGLRPDSKFACRFELTKKGSITSIVAYIAGGNTGAPDWIPNCIARAIIYSDLNGEPNALIAQSEVLGPLPEGARWYLFNLLSPTVLLPGFYWLGVQNGTGWCGNYFTVGEINRYWTNDDLFADGPSDPFGPPHPEWGLQARRSSIYANYDPIITGLDIHAFKDTTEVNTVGTIVETGQTFTTPVAIEVVPGTYTVQVTYGGEQQSQSVTVVEGVSTRVDFYFIAPVITHTLFVDSTPQSITFNIKGGSILAEYTTPTTLTLDEGVYRVTAPSVWSDAEGKRWSFVQWEDGSTNPVRDINLVADMNISFAMEITPISPPIPLWKIGVSVFALLGGVGAVIAVKGKRRG